MSRRDDEERRLEALRRYAVLDTPPEPGFERIVKLAARLFRAPMACIALVDSDREFFKASHGMTVRQVEREKGFASHTIEGQGPLVVADARLDVRFKDNAFVTGRPFIRFFAGAPLVDDAGEKLGVLAVLDLEPREPMSAEELETLTDLAALAMGELELRLLFPEAGKSQRGVREELSGMLRALRRSETNLRAVIEGAPDAVLVHQGGKVVYTNAPFLRWLGYQTVEELLGRPVLDLVHPDDRAAVVDRIRRMRETGENPPLREERILARDGSYKTGEITAIPATFDGAPAVVTMTRDVTERKQMEARLLLADRMASMGTLAAGVAHEINNPLAYVVANLGFAAERLVGAEEEVRRALQEARDGAERIGRIVRDLRVLTRDDATRRGPVDVRPIMDSCLQMAANELRHRARVVKDYLEVPLVEGTQSRLGQVFLNLLVNAAQAIPEGAADQNEISVHTSTDKRGWAVVEVRDTGQGIPRELVGRLFDPFFTTKPVGVGTGLGLSICHGIVTALGGQIEVESEPGMGSLFTVSLPPAARPPAEARPQSEPPQAQQRPARILVVDDEPLVLIAIERALKPPHEVTSLTSARAAVERLSRGERFDLILCDVMMPEMDGMTFEEEVRRIVPDAPRLTFLTGGAFTDRTRKFLEERDGRVLDKPFGVKDLRAFVRRCLLD